MRQALLFSLAALLLVAPVSAQQPLNPEANAKLGALRQRPRVDPNARLLAAQDALKKALAEKTGAALAAKSRIVCGMTVVEMAPSSDPKMGVTPPKDDKTRYTIRAVEPPICNGK
jgi:hypothetical protein